MFGYRRTHGACSQTPTIFPLGNDSGFPAMCFNVSLVCGLKDGLPRKTKPIAKISHVHDLLLGKTLSDLRGNASPNSPAVSNRRFAAMLRSSVAIEEDP